MDDRQQTLDLIRANAVNHAYFFDGLEDPGWLDFLAEEGFFKKPPAAEREGDWVSFPTWPESAYLARVAAASPERVSEIALTIPPTDNASVMSDLARIATVLPARPAKRLAGRIREWLADNQIVLTLPDASATLVAHLAEIGEVDRALDLAGELLRVEGEERPGALEPRTEPVGRVDRWQYGRLLELVMPALLGADRDRALGFLADLLSRAVDLEAGSEGGDYTYIIRPSIADHAQNHNHGLIDVLIAAVRDATVEAAAGDEGRAAVLGMLGGREQPVFARLALHVITTLGDTEEVLAALTHSATEASVALWHEYADLLSRRFSDLDAGQREAVLEFLAAVRQEPTPGEGEEETEHDRRRHLLRRLELIGSELEGPMKKTYEDLVAEFGRPDHPAFLSYMTSFTGPTSPLDVTQLRELGPEGTLAALAGWESPGGFEDPTPEGLARVLEEAVKDEPRGYAEIANRFRSLEPTYVRGLLNGLAAAMKEERSFDWTGVLELCAWVLDQPFESDEARGAVDRDPGWSWSRKAIADLLNGALDGGPIEAPIEAREQLFGLLDALSDDPNPTPEHEERFGGKNMDPATLALNTTRGEAMNAVLRYTLWVERNQCEDGKGSGIAPEARAILDRHLDPEVDPSLAVRSVYGRWFAHLFNLDLHWLRTAVPRIFPADPEQAELFAAAFDAFLAFTRPWPKALDLLGPAYATGAGRAGAEPRSRTFHGNPRTVLGDHLIALRAYGAIDLQPGGLLDVFWSNASAEVRGAVVRNAGWTVERTENPDPLVFTRLAETWEWIAARESGEDAKDVLKGFGAWLAAPNLDPSWLMQQALDLLARGIPLDPDFAAYAALPRLGGTDVNSALAVLRGMLDAEGRSWAPMGSRDEIRELLEAAFASPVDEIREEAGHLVDQLIVLGLHEFRDLVDPGGQKS